MEDCAEKKRRQSKAMKIEIIPGTRDEEKIKEIKEARQRLTDEEWQEYCFNLVCESEDWYDALYYASEDGDTVLEKWEWYFLERLMDDEKYYYAGDMGGFDY